MEKAERAWGILHHHMSERMKALVKEEMNPVDLLRNLEERINPKEGSNLSNGDTIDTSQDSAWAHNLL